ncbi:MAG: DUF3347 domain-containing protein [Chitinophagaceae bacterium]
MKKLFLLLLLAGIGVFSWYFFVTRKKPKDETPVEQPLTVSNHSIEFNASSNELLNRYYALSESFVKWDTGAIRTNIFALKNNLDSLQVEELQKDPVIYQTAGTYVETLRNDVQIMMSAADITGKRRAFHSFSQGFYDFIRTIKYDQAKVYLQECPMAFNDTETAQWLSKTNEIRNPYLGLYHPKYKSGMLVCGETKDSVDFLSSPAKN